MRHTAPGMPAHAHDTRIQSFPALSDLLNGICAAANRARGIRREGGRHD